MTVACRFAPSPTGLLHIGGARTALFNWAFARRHQGRYLVRIEDTDRKRSSAANEQMIHAALDWLGLAPDGAAVRQSERAALYRERAAQLLEQGCAYRCYASDEELQELRAGQEARKEKPRYDRRWRGRTDYPANAPYCIRFAVPEQGSCQIDDLIRGTITSANSELDDLVILRADGTATYNFAAAVDDQDMRITHVIRGEDHITNTLRQVHIHRALGGQLPSFAHLPLILGPKRGADGSLLRDASGGQVYERLSKRNSAVDIDHYRGMGILPQGLVNYLAQLGWTQPDAEIYAAAELAAAFDIAKISRSAARFDLDRLLWVNQQHMRRTDPAKLAKLAALQAPSGAIALGCEKARTLGELAGELSWLNRPEQFSQLLAKHLPPDARQGFAALCSALPKLGDFSAAAIKQLIKVHCKQHRLRFAKLGMPLRVVLTGKDHSPDIAEVAALLGQSECAARLQAYLDSESAAGSG